MIIYKLQINNCKCGSLVKPKVIDCRPIGGENRLCVMCPDCELSTRVYSTSIEAIDEWNNEMTNGASLRNE